MAKTKGLSLSAQPHTMLQALREKKEESIPLAWFEPAYHTEG
jgi:hypothetical protein